MWTEDERTLFNSNKMLNKQSFNFNMHLHMFRLVSDCTKATVAVWKARSFFCSPSVTVFSWAWKVLVSNMQNECVRCKEKRQRADKENGMANECTCSTVFAEFHLFLYTKWFMVEICDDASDIHYTYIVCMRMVTMCKAVEYLEISKTLISYVRITFFFCVSMRLLAYISFCSTWYYCCLNWGHAEFQLL